MRDREALNDVYQASLIVLTETEQQAAFLDPGASSFMLEEMGLLRLDLIDALSKEVRPSLE